MNERQERSPCPKRAMQWTGVRQSSDRGKQPDMTWGVGACVSVRGARADSAGVQRSEEGLREEGVPFGRMGIYLTRKRARVDG